MLLKSEVGQKEIERYLAQLLLGQEVSVSAIGMPIYFRVDGKLEWLTLDNVYCVQNEGSALQFKKEHVVALIEPKVNSRVWNIRVKMQRFVPTS